MKHTLICTCLLFASTALLAQQKAPPLSPPATATGTIGGKTITITYSSPRVKGREGKIYTNDGDLSVPAGTYTLFVDISDPANWVLIVNKKNGEWGLAYDSTQDLGKTKMTTSAPPSLIEDLTYSITDNGGGKGTLTLAWENVSATVPILVH
jgi:hypothetical protein